MQNVDQKLHDTSIHHGQAKALCIRRVVGETELDELDALVNRWAFEEGWTVIPGDLRALRSLPSVNRLVGTVNDEIISHITEINFDDAYAFITSFITRKDYRGKGFGKKLFETAVLHAGNRCIGLTCPQHMVETYTRLGFSVGHVGAFYEVDRSERFDSRHPCLMNALDVTPDHLDAFDRKYFPAGRKNFLQEWMRMPESCGLAYVENGKILGCGVIHKKLDGKTGQVGPLYADSFEVAREISGGLLSSISGVDSVRFIIFESNVNSQDFIDALELKLVAKGAKMYKNRCPKFDANGVYSMTSGLVG